MQTNGCLKKKPGRFKKHILFLELGLFSLNFINFHNMTGKYTLNKYFPTTGRHFSYSEHPLYLWHPRVASDNFLDKDFAPSPTHPFLLKFVR